MVIFVGYTHFIGIPHLQVNGGVAALDVASGRLLWGALRSDRQEGFYFPPAIDTDRIYLPGNFELR